ncbi:MAG: glycosyl transferase [Myxococcales bacterium]|nr:glycosyl transferase [Myxococcales bacterium]
MKLVMITTYATPKNMRRELLEAARARGHAVTVVAPEDPRLMSAPLAAIGAGYRQWNVHRTGIDPIADLASAGRLLSILRDERPDVVLIYQIKAVLLGPAVAKLARTPHVVTLVNGLGAVFDEQGFGATWKAKLARRIYGVSLGRVDTIVFQNPDDPELLRTLGILPKGADVRIVPGSGVDLEKLVPMRPPSAPTFTLMSRLVVSKGIREFISAARTIRSRHPEARFKLVGQLEAENHPDGVKQGELDAWVAESLVEYLGFTDDVRGVLAATTVFVLPSYYREGIPRTNLEALAMGLPIVTTDWVGCRETVEDGVNGFLVPPKDVAALTDRMERYVDDPALVAKHGAASRALAERRFDIDHVNELMMQALHLR